MFKTFATATAVVAALALFSASPALAHNCPAMISAIDAKLAEAPDLAEDILAKVQELRDEGQALHDAGQHDESVAVLSEAKELLGVE